VIDGSLDVSGNVVIDGDLDISGNENIGGNLDVSGNEWVGGNLDVSGNIVVDGNLDVSGNVVIDGDLDISGNENIGGNLDVSGNEWVGGNLDVSGNIVVDGNLDVSGNEWIGGNLDISGNIVVDGFINGSPYPPNGLVPTGCVLPFFGTTIPSGFLLCDGSSFSSTTYSALYTLLGSSNTPDLRGIFLVGSGTSGSYTNSQGNSISGQALNTYAADEVGSHTHGYSANNDNITIQIGSVDNAFGPHNRLQYVVLNGTTYNADGGSVAVNIDKYNLTTDANKTSVTNVPPSIAVNYIIKT
jgi:microcystin-dependent protein/cytoskeletal protein CcmA (bactofilin family)